jgi:hypothetical protein
MRCLALPLWSGQPLGCAVCAFALYQAFKPADTPPGLCAMAKWKHNSHVMKNRNLSFIVKNLFVIKMAMNNVLYFVATQKRNRFYLKKSFAVRVLSRWRRSVFRVYFE